MRGIYRGLDVCEGRLKIRVRLVDDAEHDDASGVAPHKRVEQSGFVRGKRERVAGGVVGQRSERVVTGDGGQHASEV